jgi:hypothetical protein
MTAKLNRALRCTAAALAVAVVGAGAAACSPSDSSAGAAAQSSAAGQPSTTQPTGASSAPSAATGQQTTAQAGGQGSAGTGGTSAQGNGNGSGNAATGAVNVSPAAASSRCHTGELKLRWNAGAPDMGGTQQQIASVKLTNIGSRTCTLYGFPGVRLISSTGETWDLPRSKDKPATLTLKPGDDTAEITINVLPIPANTTDTRPFAPAQVQITPPDETPHTTLAWP